MANICLGYYPMSVEQMGEWSKQASSLSMKETGRLLDALDRIVIVRLEKKD